MNVWSSGYTLALGGFVVVWVGVSAYVIVTRALFDVADLSFRAGRRVIERRLLRLGSTEAALTGLPARTLAGIAADASTAPPVARAAATRLLERHFARVIRRSRSHRTDSQKWRRIASLRILSIAGWAIATPLLRAALADPDADVAGAAVSILATSGTREHAELLVDALRRNVVARSRIAAGLDDFAIPILDVLRPLLDDLDPAVRQWGATLVGRYDTPSVALELAALVGDADPQVRAAALKGMARGTSPLVIPAAVATLRDPVWFVRVHAARALRRLGHPELAPDVVLLLGDPHWWVRTAAKEALEGMGREAMPEVFAALQSNDEFVRNGAAEILQNTGVMDDLVERLAEAPDHAPTAGAVRAILAAGGPGLAVAVDRRSERRATAQGR